MRITILLTLVILLSNCTPSIEVITIPNQKDIIPEGIVVHPSQDKIFISSIHQRKIIQTNKKGTTSSDFIASHQHNYLGGVGLEIKDNKLYALGSNMENKVWKSIFLVFDLKTNEVLHSFPMRDTMSILLNDLAIGEDDKIYISDTFGHKVHIADLKNKEIRTFIKDETLQYPNGIAISNDKTKLFVASSNDGIRIIDIATRKILNPPNEITSNLGLDGLKFYKGKLFALRNGGWKEKEKHGLYEITLNQNLTKVEAINPLLMNHEKMNLPTTFSIHNDFIYILANSQLDNLEQNKNEIKNRQSLTDTYLIRYKIVN